MNKLVIAISVLIGSAFLIFVGCLLGALGGALSGWIVGIVFTETFLRGLDILGIMHLAPWEFGAILGYISGFFRSMQATK